MTSPFELKNAISRPESFALTFVDRTISSTNPTRSVERLRLEMMKR